MVRGLGDSAHELAAPVVLQGVAASSPETLADGVMVTIPALGTAHQFGPCPYTAHGTDRPQVGDSLLVAMDETTSPWIVEWGTQAGGGGVQSGLASADVQAMIDASQQAPSVDSRLPIPALIECFGHSLPVAGVWSMDQTYVYKLGKKLGCRHIWHSAVGGSTSFTPGSIHRGGWSDIYQRLTRRGTDLTSVNKGGTPYVPSSQLVILHQLLNDIAFLGASNMRASVEAHRGIMSRIFAAAVDEDDQTAARTIDTTVPWAYTGTWSTVISTAANSGAGVHFTSTAGDKATYTTPADFPGTPHVVAIGLVITPAYDITLGVKIDGVAQPDIRIVGSQVCETTQSANNTHVLRFGDGSNYGLPQIAPGAHAIEITLKTINAGGSSLIIDFAQIECHPDDAPLLLLPLANREFNYGIWTSFPHGPSAGTDPIGDSSMPIANAAIQVLDAEFAGPILFVDIDSVLQKQQANFGYDQTHLNAVGHAKLAETLFNLLAASPYMTPRRLARYSHREQNCAWQEVGGFNAYGTAFQNSWLNFGGGLESAAFRLTEQGDVVIRGAVKAGGNALAIFTLPTGFWPRVGQDFYDAVACSNTVPPAMALCGVISASGAVIINGGSNVFVSFGQKIRFTPAGS